MRQINTLKILGAIKMEWFTGDFLRQANAAAKREWDEYLNRKDCPIKVIRSHTLTSDQPN